jgi:regulator of PEP synthase PpsR (kinase-PPPase family)
MNPLSDEPVIFILSDGTGETAAQMVRAALVQFQKSQIRILRFKNVRTEAQLEPILNQALETRCLLAYTIVSSSMRLKIREFCREKALRDLDLLGPLLDQLHSFLGAQTQTPQAGLLRSVDDHYYKRIAAIEYTVRHDDGKSLEDLNDADIVLIGISRTSKTPLSIFLSYKGFKVANIPLVLRTPLPKEVFEVDQRKIVGLIIDTDSLQRIRKNRLEKLGTRSTQYSSISYIMKELEYAQEIFRQNRRWPVINVTERALEETAAEIVKLIGTRMGWKETFF